MFLQKLATKKTSPLLVSSLPLRAFGGGAHEIVKADGDHKFIAACNKKTMVLDGLKPTSNLVHEISNPFRHQNDLPLYK